MPADPDTLAARLRAFCDAPCRPITLQLVSDIRAVLDKLARAEERAARYVSERNDALNLNADRAQQLARAWAAADEARAALRSKEK